MTAACPYCGTGLIEETVSDDPPREDTGRLHYLKCCREYVFTACQAYKKEMAVEAARGFAMSAQLEAMRAKLKEMLSIIDDPYGTTETASISRPLEKRIREALAI